ncbi:MAG: Divalent-cation tolerance protein CutA [Candidatus Methanofastidiosum methylothiophilum]|uniref:Divalent-cation tolerance protein CutA n=1 Tax=Candidatus Methanofastidiosum methylothiophilum TaxID=1705564 RepID=A0A150JCV0_9EURY|nr:MAG: Divalent-cation tolerance protein CutA [Candidatus Methanofastidiosum methylthiophilus]OQC52229.1 MAG: Divalent-cation tolerance protein CutA [Euryarchaeota archaeon ADurb.Bin023]HNV93741.1 divalent-cation tolerance protein CutA [Methanofastidiosum sp.]KYC56988.1 MAG: Divalent-cation tolerance protein CutA [Candidatus Methanofastidiosum methylthiophilus]KYC57989.1 MAG: Divalent-cation tolerance protein CutA [Candidatus Methanofastidiosum methylthiophilus]
MALLIISTVPNEDVARNLSKILLEKRVAACVNILSKVKSNYWWNGSIESSDEIILLIKTTEDKYSQLEDLIRKNHPYEIPEIIAFDIKKGFNKYLNWIEDETRILP